MTDKERIQQVIKYKKMSSNSFARSIGLKRADRLYHILNGRNGISEELAGMITTSHNEINYEWLLSGKGKMINTTTLSGDPMNRNIEEAMITKALATELIKQLSYLREENTRLRQKIAELEREEATNTVISKKRTGSQ